MCNLNVIAVLEFISRGLYLLFAVLLSSKFQKSIFYQHMRPKSGLKFPRPLLMKFSFFSSEKILCILNGKVFVMECRLGALHKRIKFMFINNNYQYFRRESANSNIFKFKCLQSTISQTVGIITVLSHFAHQTMGILTSPKFIP